MLGGFGGSRFSTLMRSVSPTRTRKVGAGIVPYMLRKLTCVPSIVVAR